MLNWIKKIIKRGEGKVVSVVCSADVICLLYVGCLFLGSDGMHSGIEPTFLLCVQPLVQKSPVLERLWAGSVAAHSTATRAWPVPAGPPATA